MLGFEATATELEPGEMEKDNNKMDEDQRNGPQVAAAAADDEQKKKAERKITKEALFSSREQKRAECVKKCRAVAEELSSKNSAIKEMNYLLKDKVQPKIN